MKEGLLKEVLKFSTDTWLSEMTRDNQGEYKDYDGKAIGLIAINLNKLYNNKSFDINNLTLNSLGITLFNCKNIIYATGGPAVSIQRQYIPKTR